MPKEKKDFRPYSVEDIKTVIQNWGKKSAAEICTDIGRPINSLSYLAKAIRDTGYPLPKNPKKAALKAVINEALLELGLAGMKRKE